MTMHKIYSRLSGWVTPRFRPLFLIFAAGLLITGLLTHKDNFLVTTLHAPKAVLSWETNTDNAVRDSILREWGAAYKIILAYNDQDVPEKIRVTGIQASAAQNRADYFFIFFYTGLLLLVLSRLVRARGVNGKDRRLFALLALLVLAAGALDIVEDYGTGRVLGGRLLDASAIGYPSRLKWLLLGVSVAVTGWQAVRHGVALYWLSLATGILRRTVAVLWEFRVMLLTLLLVFAVLYSSDQGQDLLLSVNAERLGVLWFLFSTTIIALLCWYMPKVLANAAVLNYAEFWYRSVDFGEDPATGNRPKAEVDLSRLLGAAGFLVPAAGILKVMDNYHMDYALSGIPPVAILSVVLVLYAVIISHHWIDDFFKSKQGTLNWVKYGITLTALFTPMIIWGLDSNRSQPYFILYLALDLFFLSLIFLVTATLRTCDAVVAKWPVAPLITLSGLGCLLLFAACNRPAFLHYFIGHSRFYTMPFVFCAVAGYLLLFSFLLFVGKRTGVTWVTLLLVIALIGATGSITNYHRVALLTANRPGKKPMDSLDRYAEKWLLAREQEIGAFPATHGNRPYPVFFVNAHGGGIRAAVWTTLVIGELDRAMRADTAHGSPLGFQHYAFSYSGASGGTVGLMLLCGARQSYGPSAPRGVDISLYRTDNLTSDIIALLGRDLVYTSFGFSGLPDRARLMEMDWEKNAADRGINLKHRFGNLWKNNRGDLPLLFSNTYDIDSGNKGIVAPVLLDSLDFPSAVLVEQELTGLAELRLSTAGFLSARFPYVSPTGKLNHNRHFTDGGTIENSAGETSLQVIRVFERVRKKLLPAHPALARIRVNILALPNAIPDIGSPVYDRNFYEPLGPPLGVLRLGGANAERAELINARLDPAIYTYTPFQPQAYRLTGKRVWPVLPLGWQISDVALDALSHNALAYPSPADTVLKQFGVTRKRR